MNEKNKGKTGQCRCVPGWKTRKRDNNGLKFYIFLNRL